MIVKVLPHALKHGLCEEDVVYAWKSPVRCRQRNGINDPALWIAIAALPDGRMAELVGFQDLTGCWCVFHAMTPPTTKFINELGLKGNRHGRN
jgi:hypothetical protein